MIKGESPKTKCLKVAYKKPEYAWNMAVKSSDRVGFKIAYRCHKQYCGKHHVGSSGLTTDNEACICHYPVEWHERFGYCPTKEQADE